MSVKSFLNLVDTNAQSYIRSANALKARTASVMTFGCQQNEADSERIRGILSDVGFSLSDEPDGADCDGSSCLWLLSGRRDLQCGAVLQKKRAGDDPGRKPGETPGRQA